MDKISQFFKLTGISFLINLCMLWTFTFQPLVSGWAYSVVYFAFTWICLDSFFCKDSNNRYLIILAIIFGRIIIDIIERTSCNLSDTILSLMVPIITIISIVLATICYNERRILMYILSTVILLLMNTFVHEAYLEHFRNLLGR